MSDSPDDGPIERAPESPRASACPFAGIVAGENVSANDFAAIVDTALEPFVSLDHEGRVLAWNAQAEVTFGWTRDEALGKYAADLIVPPSLRERHRASIGRFPSKAESAIVGKRVRVPAARRDGELLSVELRVGAIAHDDGKHTFHAFIHDVTELERMRSERDRHNAMLDESQRIAHLGSYEHDIIHETVRVSDELLVIAGLERDAFSSTVDALLDVIHPEDLEFALRMYRDALRNGSSYDFEHRLMRPSGEERIVRRRGYVTRGGEGRAINAFATVQDVTDQRRSEAQQRELTSRFARAFDDAPIGMALLDVDLRGRSTGTFRDVNAALCRLTGRTRESLLRSGLEEILEPVDARAFAGAFEDLVLDRTQLVAIEARYVSSNELRRWFLLHVSLVREPTTLGDDAYAVVQVVDITDSKRAENRLEYLAYRDPLTELLNRRGVEAQVRLFAEIASAEPVTSALLLIDLDYFKYVNDTKGHSIGDRLLQSVAITLDRSVDAGDLVARLGGDKFIVILFNVDAATAFARSEALRATISKEVERYSRSGILVSASVGVALCHDGFASGLEDTLSVADAALSEAKDRGRNRTHLSESLVGDREEMRARLDWAQRVRMALRTDGFRLFRQPILDLRTDMIGRYELLVRMIGLDGEAIDPGNFLREADRFGMMVEVDAWVVNEAIRICANDQRAGRFIVYEVNLSGASLSHEGTAHAIESEIVRQGVDPKRLIFEVTETSAISNMEKAFELATSLRSLGCQFALDDFGAGLSSFYYLKRLPFDYLKLDGEYVENLANDAQDQHIVQSIVALARGLGKKTIAEFVTDARTADLLRTYGVDYAQGFHVGRPVAFESAAPPSLR